MSQGVHRRCINPVQLAYRHSTNRPHALQAWRLKKIGDVTALCELPQSHHHENSPYAWVDAFFGPNKDTVHVIDKRTLEAVREIQRLEQDAVFGRDESLSRPQSRHPPVGVRCANPT